MKKNKRDLVLYIVRGVSGSGKSTYAKELCGDFVAEADHYFIDRDGIYRFNGAKLGEAHARCFERTFAFFVFSDKVAVANTFTRLSEMENYVREAKRNKIRVEIVEPPTPWRYNAVECASRNTHGLNVPMIERQLARWETVPEGWIDSI